MRSISKQSEPAELQNWKRQMRRDAPQNLSYGNLPSDVSLSVKQALLAEQGFVCAYTMRGLRDADDCHIEHVQPQNSAPDQDLAYQNMAACFPCNGGDVSHGYGAPVKGGQEVVLNANFVSPHSPNCEGRFLFDDKGLVSAHPHDTAAQHTIETLRLDHRALVELRRSAMEAFGLTQGRRTTRTAHRPMSAKQASDFARQVLQPDAKGRLEPFCVALSQVAKAFASKEEARAQRMKAQRLQG